MVGSRQQHLGIHQLEFFDRERKFHRALADDSMSESRSAEIGVDGHGSTTRLDERSGEVGSERRLAVALARRHDDGDVGAIEGFSPALDERDDVAEGALDPHPVILDDEVEPPVQASDSALGVRESEQFA